MFASHGTLSSIHDVVPEVPMKLDCLDRVPFSYRPGLSRSSMDQSHPDPRRSPFDLISVIMLHGMSTCGKQILVGALNLSRVTLTVPAFPEA
jgi:hypothetical protein